MIVRAAVFLSLLGSAVAAPAIVWQRAQSSSPMHHSDSVEAADLLKSVVGNADEQSVLFFLGRQEDGTEMLGHLAGSGALPRTQTKYQSAHAIHHHVDGVESAQTVARDAMAMAAGSQSSTVMTVSLSEFFSKIQGSPESVSVHPEDGNHVHSKAEKEAHRRSRDLSTAHTLIVNVPASTKPSELDNAIVTAVDSDTVSSVVLTAQRSIDEVKRERANLSNRRKLHAAQQDAPRRRLEDGNDNNNNNNNNNQNNNNNEDGDVHYVNMTPNILAGILYTIMFIAVTQIGIGCMGQIQGGDVYVKKQPTIGREA